MSRVARMQLEVPAGVLPEDIFKPSSDPALMAVSLVTYENHLSLMKTLKLADLRLHFVNIFKATYKGFKSSAKLSELQDQIIGVHYEYVADVLLQCTVEFLQAILKNFGTERIQNNMTKERIVEVLCKHAGLYPHDPPMSLEKIPTGETRLRHRLRADEANRLQGPPPLSGATKRERGEPDEGEEWEKNPDEEGWKEEGGDESDKVKIEKNGVKLEGRVTKKRKSEDEFQTGYDILQRRENNRIKGENESETVEEEREKKAAIKEEEAEEKPPEAILVVEQLTEYLERDFLGPWRRDRKEPDMEALRALAATFHRHVSTMK